MTASESIPLFLGKFFLGKRPLRLTDQERKAVDTVKALVRDSFEKPKRPARYVLGLAIDFLLQSQELSKIDAELCSFRGELTEDYLFNRYSLVTERSGQKANTLSLSFADTTVGIRKFEEAVTSFFHSQNRTEYPSAYVYNTGQWTKYKQLLVYCFSLSTDGRFVAASELLEYGLIELKENEFFGRKLERIHLFQEIINHYPRSHEKENGGLVFQAIANGYFIADRPHLCIVSDKVRTGSARQKRIGDIDCYKGLDLECSVEVKDLAINSANFEHQLRTFSNNVKDFGVLGIAFVKSVDFFDLTLDMRESLVFLTIDDVLSTIRIWDWAKQEIAVHGMLHYLSHIEQSSEAVNRLLEFISQQNSGHSSIEYLKSS